MAFISGYISNYEAGVNDHVASGMITSYVPSSGDIVVACSCPNADNSGTPAADNINVWLTYEDSSTTPSYTVPRWVFKVSDTTYTGDVSFEIITRPVPSGAPSPNSANPPPNFMTNSMSQNAFTEISLYSGKYNQTKTMPNDREDPGSRQREIQITAEDVLASLQRIAIATGTSQSLVNTMN
jgi:hypothetical protein